MEVYFCDVCAARVSDHDLHRGQGIKQDDIVVCASCLDQGLGKDLLTPVVVSRAPAEALAGEGVLDGPRDRAQTRFATEPDDDGDSAHEPSDYGGPPTPDPIQDETADVPRSASDETRRSSGFGSLASGLGALGQHQPRAAPQPPTDPESLPDDPGLELLDEAGRPVDPPEVQTRDGRAETEESTAVADEAKGGGERDERGDEDQGARSFNRRGRKSSPSNRRTGGSGRQATRSATRSTTRARARGGSNPAVIWGISGVSLALLILLGGMVALGGRGSRNRQHEYDSTREALRGESRRIDGEIVSALRGKDVARMRALLDEIRHLRDLMNQFEQEMKGEWTDDQIFREIQLSRSNDVVAKSRNLRDRIAVLEAQQ